MERVLLMTVIVGFSVGSLAAHEAKSDARPVVYNNVTDSSNKLDAEAKKIYASKFRVVEATQKEGLVPARLKGRPFDDSRSGPKDPRGTREREVSGKVVCVYLITADGRVIEPHILETIDERLSRALEDSVIYRRYVPAKFQGMPVVSIGRAETRSGGESGLDDRMFRNGLGIQGANRDR